VFDIVDADVPAALAATKWIRLGDLSTESLADCADKVQAGVFGKMPPPIAPTPAYAGIAVHQLPSLSANDERVFAVACGQLIGRPIYHPAVGMEDLIAECEKEGLHQDQVVESVAALEQHYYITDVAEFLGSGGIPSHFRISTYGLDVYLAAYEPEKYRHAKNAVLSEIVNRNGHDLSMIIINTAVPEYLARHIVQQIENSGQARVAWYSGGASIMQLPTLRRLLEDD
jgi:hypothetical protein